MNTLAIIEKQYKKDTDLYHLLIEHSIAVRDKALALSAKHPELGIDTLFVAEAAMLHDIGIFLTAAPAIHCYGIAPYICHGYMGRELLDKEGLPRHGLVCERHTGTGISLQEIEANKLPLPHRAMLPISIEEQLICFADCFFSKTKLGQEQSVEEVRRVLSQFGEQSVRQFDEWSAIFL